MAAPCGFGWVPPVPATVLAGLFELEKGDLALWTEEGYELIERSAFVRASRSAARLTAKGTHGAI